jgi:DNA polymerase type B, organellar and viral
MFNRYQLNITKFTTLSSLAFGIFRAHFLKDTKIPLISGQMLADIRQGYYGGATDMYIPSGDNIFTYDVNSLYPFVMANFPMAVGKKRFFEGNILDVPNFSTILGSLRRKRERRINHYTNLCIRKKKSGYL